MMTVLCTAFRKKEVIPSVLPVDMRSFRISSSESGTEMMDLADLLSGLDIDLTDLDVSVLPEEIALAILEIEGWIATSDFEIDEDRIRPLSCRIVSIDIEMAS